MKLSPESIIAWFHRTLGVNNQPNRDEIQTNCPECGHEQFYFNVRKQIGICHRASCNITPNLKDLIDRIGFGPDSAGFWENEDHEVTVPEVEMKGWPVLKVFNGHAMTSDEAALEYLRNRGLDDNIILNWEITSDGERVYVPIYFEDRLVNFNSRVLPGVPGRKYLYSPGAKTSKYILGWSECKLWPRISLVENTFVSLWLRRDLYCSTLFGSNVSDVQADLIAESKVKTVVLLWDENAERGAERGIKKLHERGVAASYWSILGQPDDYPKEWVETQAARVFTAAERGIPFVDIKEECKDALH